MLQVQARRALIVISGSTQSSHRSVGSAVELVVGREPVKDRGNIINNDNSLVTSQAASTDIFHYPLTSNGASARVVIINLIVGVIQIEEVAIIRGIGSSSEGRSVRSNTRNLDISREVIPLRSRKIIQNDSLDTSSNIAANITSIPSTRDMDAAVVSSHSVVVSRELIVVAVILNSRESQMSRSNIIRAQTLIVGRELNKDRSSSISQDNNLDVHIDVSTGIGSSELTSHSLETSITQHNIHRCHSSSVASIQSSGLTANFSSVRSIAVQSEVLRNISELRRSSISASNDLGTSDIVSAIIRSSPDTADQLDAVVTLDHILRGDGSRVVASIVSSGSSHVVDGARLIAFHVIIGRERSKLRRSVVFHSDILEAQSHITASIRSNVNYLVNQRASIIKVIGFNGIGHIDQGSAVVNSIGKVDSGVLENVILARSSDVTGNGHKQRSLVINLSDVLDAIGRVSALINGNPLALSQSSALSSGDIINVGNIDGQRTSITSLRVSKRTSVIAA